MVKEHNKWLRDGKPHHWSEHNRKQHDGRTEAPTEEHTLFVKEMHTKLSGYQARAIIKLSDKDSILKVSDEIVIEDRRCDLLVESFIGRKICIECQISKLSSNDLYDRTFTYLKNGYEVIWVRRPGIKYQVIYYWLIDDCNGKRQRKESELSDNLRLICKNTYCADLPKGFNPIYVRILRCNNV